MKSIIVIVNILSDSGVMDIFVIDDDATSQIAMGFVLKKLGHSVYLIENINHAWELASNLTPGTDCIVFLDLFIGQSRSYSEELELVEEFVSRDVVCFSMSAYPTSHLQLPEHPLYRHLDKAKRGYLKLIRELPEYSDEMRRDHAEKENEARNGFAFC